MKGKENRLDNVLHAVLLIYFHCFISRKLLFGKVESCGDDWTFTFEKQNGVKKINEKEFMK